MTLCYCTTLQLRSLATRRIGALVLFFVLFCLSAHASVTVVSTSRQKSLAEWRSLTSPNTAPPRVFVKGNRVRFYFQAGTNASGFSASWHHLRVPTDGYAASSAMLRWDQDLSHPPDARGWREATVIGGAAWRHYVTNLIQA